MGKDARLQVRMDAGLKDEVESFLHRVGLDHSTLVTMLYHYIRQHQRLPFKPRIPNEKTRQAMRELEEGEAETYEVQDDETPEEAIERMMGDIAPQPPTRTVEALDEITVDGVRHTDIETIVRTWNNHTASDVDVTPTIEVAVHRALARLKKEHSLDAGEAQEALMTIIATYGGIRHETEGSTFRVYDKSLSELCESDLLIRLYDAEDAKTFLREDSSTYSP